MNILPLIIGILCMLAFATTTLMRQGQAVYLEGRSYTGFMQAERIANNEMSRYLYYKTLSAKKKRSAPKSKPEGGRINRADRSIPSELSKLNIGPLFEKKSTLLYEIAAHLIYTLYKDAPFFKKAGIPKLEYAILDALIAQAHLKKEAHHLKDLFPTDPKLRALFYKMAKGTNLGYPAFGDYFLVDRHNERKPIFFSHTSPPLLQVLFGIEGLKAILDEEKKLQEEIEKKKSDEQKEIKKYYALTQEQLNHVLKGISRKPFEYSKVQELLDFSRKAAPKQYVVASDEDTKILVKKEV